MWKRVFEDRRVWAVAVVFGVVLFVAQISMAVWSDDSALPHLLQSLIWVALTPLWYARYRKSSPRTGR